MRFELTRVGLLVELANHYTTKGALVIREEYEQEPSIWIEKVNTDKQEHCNRTWNVKT